MLECIKNLLFDKRTKTKYNIIVFVVIYYNIKYIIYTLLN